MKKNKEILMSGFALFSLFFGAGNLILPPMLGNLSGAAWWMVVLGFMITAVCIPILGIFAHAKVQGTLYDLAKPVAHWFSAIFCFCIYLIAITLPAPRTASVTHEIAVAPFVNTPPWLTSSVYFMLVFIFVLNRSKILSFIGKLLTPIIILILLLIIGLSIGIGPEAVQPSSLKTPFVYGILEGYQTYDAIGGVVVGAVIIISLNLRGYQTYEAKKELITKSGLIAGIGLLVIYGGLILSGALLGDSFPEDATRIQLLTGITKLTLGSIGASFLSVLVSLACFTTAVGVITGASDYASGIFNHKKRAYTVTALLSCLIGIVVGSYEVGFIITIGFPALMFIYPITIVIILLHVLPNTIATPRVFKWVVGTTFVFSIPDFLAFIIPPEQLAIVQYFIPLSSYKLGWVLPAIVAFLVALIFNKSTK